MVQSHQSASISMTPTITIFYSLFDDKLLKIEKLGEIEKNLDSLIRACLMKGYKVNNYQDRVVWS